MHLNQSQTPGTPVLNSAKLRYLERTKAKTDPGLKPRSHSVNTYDDYRSQDLMERMQYIEERMHSNIKGNIRGHSIQEPSLTQEQLLTGLSEPVAFNI